MSFFSTALIACQLAVVPGPDTAWVSRNVACAECRIELRERATLRLPGRPAFSPPFFSIARSRDGQYLTTGFGKDSGIMVFTSGGDFTRDIRGSLPGGAILRRPKQISVTADGSMLVLDGGANAVLRLAPALQYGTLDTLKSVSADMIAELGSGGILVAGLSSVPLSAGFPLHRLAPSSAGVSHPIGAEVVIRPDRLPSTWRIIAPGANGHAWVSRVNTYAIELIDSSGRVLRVLRSAPPWFGPWEVGHDPFSQAPNPAVGGLQTTPDGLLVVFIGVAARNYKPRTPGGSSLFGIRKETSNADLSDLLALYDTVVEVINPRSGHLLASRRFEGLLFPGAAYPTVAQTARTLLGRRYVSAMELVLTLPGVPARAQRE